MCDFQSEAWKKVKIITKEEMEALINKNLKSGKRIKEINKDGKVRDLYLNSK